MMKTLTGLALGFSMMMAGSVAMAADAGADNPETPIGEEQTLNFFDIAAVYLDPIDMEPHGMDLPASQADVHLELDLHAAKENPNGFGAGEWVPYLTISYRLENKDTGKSATGSLMPMVAADGPHYGSNIKMLGAGNYKVTFNLENPEKQHFGRHTDKATGVGPWFQPFSVSYDFSYVPKKKK